MLSPQLILSGCPLFSKLEPEHIDQIAAECVQRTLKEDEPLWLENSYGDELVVLAEGALCIFLKLPTQEDFVLKQIASVGSFVGEHGWWSGGIDPRTRSVRATKPTTLIIIPQKIRLFITEVAPDFGDRLSDLKMDQLNHRSIMLGAQFCYRLISSRKNAKRLYFKPKEDIFKQDSTGEHAYLIIRGEVDVWQRDLKGHLSCIESLRTGQIVGERAILENRKRKASLIARSAVELLEVDQSDLQKLAQIYPDARDYFSALRHIEWLDQDRLAIQFIGEFESKPAFITVYYLDDHACAIGFKTIGEDRYFAQSFERSGAKVKGKVLGFSSNDERKRNIWLNEERYICRLDVEGEWASLQDLQAAMLFQQPLTTEKIAQLSTRDQAKPDPLIKADEMICSCLQVSRSLLMSYYNSGTKTVSELIARTNVGTGCGGCIPAISELCQQSFSFNVRLTGVIKHTPDIWSFMFTHPQEIEYLEAKPGQHIFLSIHLDNTWLSRSYTLTSPINFSEHRQVTIKRVEGGKLSSALFSDLRHSLPIKLSQPRGDFTFDPKAGPPIVFFAAGIGITPAVSFCTVLAELGYPRGMFLHHSVNKREDFIFEESFLEQASSFKNFHYVQRVTSVEGRLSGDVVHRVVEDHLDHVYYLCGPPTYNEMIRMHLLSLGISNDAIHEEVFAPSSNKAESPHQKALSAQLPAQIEKMVSGNRASSLIKWITLSGIILFLAQDLFMLKVSALDRWQSQSTVRNLTGFLCLIYLIIVWWLPFHRDPHHLDKTHKLNRHRLLGSIAPLVLFVHATHTGFAALFALSLSFLFVAGAGSLEVSPKSSLTLNSIWLSVHISVAVLMISLLALHVYTVMAFQ